MDDFFPSIICKNSSYVMVPGNEKTALQHSTKDPYCPLGYIKLNPHLSPLQTAFH
jgi:hypothetical protein